MGWFNRFINSQLADNANVAAEQRWSGKENAFFLNSPAGLIRYRPKDLKDHTRFRDRWVNQFERIKECALNQKDLKLQMYHLYRDIRKNEKVSYRANVHTRVRSKLCIFRLSF